MNKEEIKSEITALRQELFRLYRILRSNGITKREGTPLEKQIDRIGARIHDIQTQETTDEE